MLSDEIIERAVTDICNDARLSSKGQHGDYYRCIIAQTIAAATAELGNQLEAVAGALADSGIDFKTTDHAEAVRELTLERDELRRRAEWRPIATAPKDGTVLACGLDSCGNFRRGLAYYDSEPRLGGYGPWRWGLTFQPTLWCPLPEPPAALEAAMKE